VPNTDQPSRELVIEINFLPPSLSLSLSLFYFPFYSIASLAHIQARSWSVTTD